jgi:hypothetical protein
MGISGSGIGDGCLIFEALGDPLGELEASFSLSSLRVILGTGT